MNNNTITTTATRRRHGQWFCHPKLGLSAIHHIPVSPEFTWAVIRSVEGRAIALNRVKSIQRLDDSQPHTPLVAGSKFRQVFEMTNGEKRSVDVKVTSISGDCCRFPRSISFWGSWRMPFRGSRTSTATLTVDRSLDDNENECRVIVSYGLISQGFMSNLVMSMFLRCVANTTNSSLLSNLDDIAAFSRRVGGELPPVFLFGDEDGRREDEEREDVSRNEEEGQPLILSR